MNSLSNRKRCLAYQTNENQECPPFIFLVLRFYQVLISPVLVYLFRSQCRFYPSCSTYAMQAFSKYPFTHASVKTGRRLMRCHPWNAGGVDYP